ncbi:putative nuclease HARBI1 isoform X2 [Rhagoletis pomonella]|uniref:putative nuclease HARBI1 isoform X2 n=1 Tax=Rhagoletis pomonella TaxID=28610 RepID=UPI001785C2DA|nr:putative nuclease HARBI1 isoform X2 [Rhagoletis pomonella]
MSTSVCRCEKKANDLKCNLSVSMQLSGKEAFMYVLHSIRSELKVFQRSTAVTEIVKLSTTLKFLAQGGYQHSIGQDRHAGLAQQTVSTCILEVCNAIGKVLCSKHIVFHMNNQEKVDANRSFYQMCGIPGVIGVVDGTHIQIIRPTRNEHLFFNRKLKHSINAMVVCDHRMRIRAVNGRFGGASHDSHVWNLSSERDYLKSNYENGDKGVRILEILRKILTSCFLIKVNRKEDQ